MINEPQDDLYVPEGMDEEEPIEQNRLLKYIFGKIDPKTEKILKRVIPHSAIMIAVFVYTIGGGYIFYAIEHPYRMALLEKSQATTIAAQTDQATPSDDSTSKIARSTTNLEEKWETIDTTNSDTTENRLTSTKIDQHNTTSINGTTTVATTLLTTLPNQPKKRQVDPKSVFDYDQDEDEEENMPIAKKKCTRRALSVVIESARKACVLAHAPVKEGKAGEFRAHLCSNLLAQLSSCILTPGFNLDATEEMETTTKMMTTTARTTVADTTTYPPPTPIIHKQCESAVKEEDLTPSSYIFMAFTIISTIGYGHVAPVSMWGRVFCIVYGLFGIPLALLAIADQGRFLSAAIMFIYKKIKLLATQRYGRQRRNATTALETEGGEEEEESMPALLLLILFGGYMLIGGAVLTPYEKDWSYIDAVYFTFISSSSIGFGDLLPQEGRYLPLTLFYVALGLALSTAAIDVFAGYLRRLHHWGTKIRNCANKLILFGGQRVTLSQLVRNIGVQMGVSEDKINHMMENFDEIVEATVEQVESGLPPTLSAAPLLVEEEKPKPKEPKFVTDIDFIDERNE